MKWTFIAKQRERLAGLHIPEKGVVKTHTVSPVFIECYKEKVKSSLALLNLQLKIERLKEIAKEKTVEDEEFTPALIAILKYMKHETCPDHAEYTKTLLMTAME